MDVKEIIILLKQYGTPVWVSAMTGAKFTAWLGISAGVLGFIAILAYFLLLHKKWKEENNGLTEVYIVIGGIALLAITFFMCGIYKLATLDYQVYKMILLK